MQDRFMCRLWDKSISEMSYDVCVGFIKDGTFPNYWVCADTTCGQITYTEDKLKDICLMQCTGLKDKNGKLIYEGDIVSIDDGELKGVAQRHDKFDEYYGCIEIKLICKHTTIYKPTVFVESEVIGNIYENPELLEVSNDH